MKLKRILMLCALALVAGCIEALYPSAGIIVAMAGAYYADPKIGAGKTPVGHPLNYSVYRNVESGEIPFGYGVKDGTDATKQAELFDSDSAVFRGIAMDRVGTIEREKYITGEGIDIAESGIVTAVVLEAVSPGDPVRIRHTGVGSSATTSYQEVEGSSAWEGADASGLDNDITEYTESIQIGSDMQNITIVGQEAQTITLLLGKINDALDGAEITIATGKLRITATASGAGHEIDIKAGGNLFSTLTKFKGFLDPVDGVDAVEASDTVGAFLTTADENKTALIVGAEFRSSTAAAGVAQIFLPAGKKTITADT